MNFLNVRFVKITWRLESTTNNASCIAEKMVCIPDSRFAICFWSCSNSLTIFSSWNPMRCTDTVPSIKNVRGRSPRPICVMTSSTCRHGAIHLRQTMKAMQPKATQIRIMTNQVTAFVFSSRYFSQQSGCQRVSQCEITVVILVRPYSSWRWL